MIDLNDGNKKILYWAIGAVVLIGSIFLFFRDYLGDKDEKVIVHVDHKYGNYFISEKEIKSLVKEIKSQYTGSNRVNLRVLEEKLKENKFVHKAEVSRDVEGNLVVSIEQDTPVARLISDEGKGGYLSVENTILPLSDNYTARVLVLSGGGIIDLYKPEFFETNEGKVFVEFVKYISNDPFWKAQLAQVEMDQNHDLVLLPQLGKQKILFGSPSQFYLKLKHLKRFYDEIIPKKGWNYYQKVDLRFDNQIVCSR